MRTSLAFALAIACAPAPDDLARAVDARGGRGRLLGMGTVHLEGSLRFVGAEPIALSAFLDAPDGRARGRVAFTQGTVYRALLLEGGRGFERDEAGAYREAKGDALAELQAEVTTLLLAARFPLEGTWQVAESARLRREADGVDVEIDRDGLLTRARVPGARHEVRRFGRWREWSGIRFPSVIEALEGDEVRWRLDADRWSPHAFALASFFRPPVAPDELALEDEPRGPSARARQAPFAHPFLRRDLALPGEVVSLPSALAVGSQTLRLQVAALATKRADLREVWGRLDAAFAVAALEIVGPRAATGDALGIALAVRGSDGAPILRDRDRALADAARSAGLDAGQSSPRLLLHRASADLSEWTELVRPVRPSVR